jgi:hypothetical protein
MCSIDNYQFARIFQVISIDSRNWFKLYSEFPMHEVFYYDNGAKYQHSFQSQPDVLLHRALKFSFEYYVLIHF